MFDKGSLETLDESHSKVPRTAGFWSVLFMTVGIQFAGMTVGWNGGASYGLGYMILTNVVIGLMYVLLTLCFAELTSIVAFPGGSFGYCRASLGPFWGFMVGVTEMFDNFIVVMISALSVGSACTELFGTSRDIEPVWYLIFYLILYGVHLRGGILLWYFIITCGIFVMVLIAIYCFGLVSAIDVNKYCMPNGDSFIGGSRGFMESLVFPVWFYLGVELVPQTCDRVKNVNVNLPRGMILGNLLSVFVSFWVLIAASCTFPGISDDFAASPLPLIPGYYRIFESTKSIGAIIAIVSIFSVSTGYMWGCGYQVSSLAQSGLMPRVLSSTFGVNNTPYFSLALSSICQVVVCVLLWKYAPLVGPPLLLQTVIIGASLVYVSIFCAFIVFRLRFGAMKRHWKNPVGINGAVVGIILALLLFLSAVGFQGSNDSLIVYVVYMTCAALYYVTYARYRQYFSPDEQKHFMKAYILNAKNTKSRSMKKGPSFWSSHMLALPMQRLLEIPSSMMGSGRQSSHSGSVSNHSLTLQKPTPSSSSSQTWRRYYVVAPEPPSSPTFDFIVSNMDSLCREEGIPDADSFERIVEDKQSSPDSLISSPTANLTAVENEPPSTTQHQRRRYSPGSSARHSDHLSLNNNIVAMVSPRSDEVVHFV